MILHRPLLYAAILSAAFSLGAEAGQVQPIVNDAPRPQIDVPPAGATPLVTAAADDPAWTSAAVIPLTTLSLSSAPPPAAPIPGTEVRLLWSPKWLYVRFLCKDDQPPYLPVHGPGAPIYRGDVVELFLDPIGDYREWMELEFNATNDIFDQITLCTAEPKWDPSLCLTNEICTREIWDFPDPSIKDLRSAAAPWQVNGQTIGWIVDVAIPASSLTKRMGLKALQPTRMRGNFLRYKWIPQPTGTKRDLMSLTWSPVPLYVPHRCPAGFGRINLSATHP